MVVSLGCRIVRPGVIEQVSGNEIVVGEPDGTASERVSRLAKALGRAGFEVRISANIRAEIWDKMWGNSALNPICALTDSTIDEVIQSRRTRALAKRMMVEIAAVAGGMGVRLEGAIEDRLDRAQLYGAHRGSMAQDLQAGRPPETEALVGALSELGGRVGVPTPTLDIILALMRQRATAGG
jgi:2-dehydropantoate 2-reductase